jgi:lysophospholipid acyltransferase (LPLAT)-like uncharacterized protein
MSLTKKFLKSEFGQKILSRILAGFIWLVYVSSRKTFVIDDGSKPYMRGEGNGIFSFWHGRMMLLPAICPPKHKMRVLISHHRDGLLISRTIGHFGQATVSGSSSKGGKEAVSEILRALENGDNISITPDGPRGPTQVATKGIVTLARLSKKPILPVTFSATRNRRLNSWDRFMLAMPFGRIVFYIGPPMLIDENADEDTARMQVETAMNSLVEKADEAVHG